MIAPRDPYNPFIFHKVIPEKNEKDCMEDTELDYDG